ncbi:MAG: RraA family protein [Chloroflexi bacterium]|nr:RraA family protein [Chloroflexota bacterium]
MQPSSTPVIPSPTSDVLRLAQYTTATLSDARKSFGIMRPNIRPLAPGMRIAGVAHTVKCYPGSIITVHKALLEARPGEVLVVDGEGDDRGALFGELMTLQARANGLAGIVVDGPVRDRAAVVESGFAVFAACVTPRVGSNRRVGETQIPIQCGGVVVRPGDLIVGDDDGVAVISAEEVEAAVDAAEAIKRKEIGYRASIAEGQQLADLIGFRQLIYPDS